MNFQSLGHYTKLAFTTFLVWKPSPDAQAPVSGDAALARLNTLFHARYTAAKEHAIGNLGPVIVAGGHLTLVWPDGRHEESTYTDALANNLKYMAHVPLAVSVATQTTESYDHDGDETHDDDDDDDDDDEHHYQHHQAQAHSQAQGQEIIHLPPSTREAMQDYRAALDEARNRLDSLGFTTPSQLHRQHRIANASASALAALLSSTAAGAAAALTTPGQRQGRGQEQQQEQQQPLGMPRSDLTTFARAMAPLVMANVQDAAAIQLDSINARVHAWRAALGPERWRELRVVVTTGHMPRAGFLPGQYFERMLRENGRTGRTGRTRGSCGGSGDNGGTGADGRGRGDGGEEEVPEKRLFYMEVARPDVAGVLDFLGTHVVDGKAGVEFFGDAGRLHRDILADAAARYLDGMDLPPWP